MVFTRRLEDLEFDDVKNLKQRKIPESDILDYKANLIDDAKLVKHVSAFANTNGGYIIFGIQETGRGGIPKAIPGVDKNKIDKERTEQILISNIHPRLHVKFSHLIDIPNSDKCVLVLQIPNSHLKPHLNVKSGKFHKRHDFSAPEMTEIEISDAYRRRFETYQELDKEIDRIKEKLGGPIRIFGQIVIIPTIIVRNLIDTYNERELSWIDPYKFKAEPKIADFGDYIPNIPVPSANGVRCVQYRGPRERTIRKLLEIHRNGAISYIDDYGFSDDDRKNKLKYKKLCVRLLQTLDFAREFYSRYNYFGNVKVVVFMSDMLNTCLTDDGLEDRKICEKEEVILGREVSTNLLETDLNYIASNICDELFNHFQEWKCWLFDGNGLFDIQQFKRFE